jgi:glycerophosphoryl diester phosphodiesterase
MVYLTKTSFMRTITFLFIATVLLISCNRNNPLEKFDFQGHRGARGLYPENSINGMLLALDYGVRTLEMDVVITADNRVVLSHEPFLSHLICLDAEGNPISTHNEKMYNIYEMTYDSLAQCDCGSVIHPDFPEQQHEFVVKPLLTDVIEAVKRYCDTSGIEMPFFNIEIKSNPAVDLIFHPGPPDYVRTVLDVVRENGIESQTILQSFDPRPLRIINGRYPEITTSWLIEDQTTVDSTLDVLGFRPDILSPQHVWLDTSFVNAAHRDSMRVIPWTVNDQMRASELIEMGVDGIITDYPDRISAATLGK